LIPPELPARRGSPFFAALREFRSRQKKEKRSKKPERRSEKPEAGSLKGEAGSQKQGAGRKKKKAGRKKPVVCSSAIQKSFNLPAFILAHLLWGWAPGPCV